MPVHSISPSGAETDPGRLPGSRVLLDPFAPRGRPRGLVERDSSQGIRVGPFQRMSLRKLATDGPGRLIGAIATSRPSAFTRNCPADFTLFMAGGFAPWWEVPPVPR
jgi:hypothetical protein